MLIKLKENWKMPKSGKEFASGSVLEVLPWLRDQLVKENIAEDHVPTKKEKKSMKQIYKAVK